MVELPLTTSVHGLRDVLDVKVVLTDVIGVESVPATESATYERFG